MIARPLLRLLTVLALAIAALVFARVRYGVPAPSPESAPVEQFSGDRARATLRRILEDDLPHPTGSDAAMRFRGRIMTELESMGYAPRALHGFACGRYGACAFVSNIIAELPAHAAVDDSLVLVSAHSDSVGASPGANDDGTGVAGVLEIARALRASPPTHKSVLFVIDDAEEEGLLGALAFAATPEMARVRAAVNLDARGSRGPSTIFETSGGSLDVARILASAVPRPVTSSLFFEIYRRMPNDSDFTVWKRTARGANLAFVGDIQHYHSPLDRFDTTSAGTMQQQGDAALGIVRAFADGEGDRAASGRDAVWFDVLAFGIVRWDAVWTAPIAWLALGLVLGAMARRTQIGHLRVASVLVALAAPVLAVAIAVALSVAILSVLGALGALPAPWTANGGWIMAAMWIAGPAGAALAGATSASAGDEGTFFGVWTTVATLGAIVAATIPGASYLLVVPALAAGLAGFAPTSIAARTALPALASIVVFAPVVVLLYDAIGTAGAPLAAGTGAILASTVAPLAAPLGRRWCIGVSALLGIVSVAAAAVAASLPPFTSEVPSRANVIFAQDEVSARVLIDDTWGNRAWGPFPPSMRAALGPDAHEGPEFPWSAASALQASTARADITPPDVQSHITTDAPGTRRITLHVRSTRGARNITLAVPSGPGVRINRVGASAYTAPALSSERWSVVRVTGVPDDGVAIELVAPTTSIDVTVLDETQGVPSIAASVLSARPPMSTATQRGDVTLVVRHMHF